MGVLNSFVLDWQVRMKIATNLNKFILDTLIVPNFNDVDETVRNQTTESSLKLSCVSSEFDGATYQMFGKGASEVLITDLNARQVEKNKIDVMVATILGLNKIEFENILSSFPIVDDSIKNDVLSRYLQEKNA